MNKLWSTASLFTANLVSTRGPAAHASVYLTFDDGPHPDHTPALLDVLATHGAKGAFFLIGKAVQQHPEVVHRLLAEGHAIGNHSMTHPQMRTLSAAAQWAEVQQADAVLQPFDDQARHAFRPPNGRVTPALLAASLWRRQPLVLWTLDSFDYKLPPADVVAHLQTHAPTPGDVILFHDDGPCAAQALTLLLPLWRQAGLRFPVLAP
jgi:peptidoglycan-N-acetylglucosamine deacetylase